MRGFTNPRRTCAACLVLIGRGGPRSTRNVECGKKSLMVLSRQRGRWKRCTSVRYNQNSKPKSVTLVEAFISDEDGFVIDSEPDVIDMFALPMCKARWQQVDDNHAVIDYAVTALFSNFSHRAPSPLRVATVHLTLAVSRIWPANQRLNNEPQRATRGGGLIP